MRINTNKKLHSEAIKSIMSKVNTQWNYDIHIACWPTQCLCSENLILIPAQNFEGQFKDLDSSYHTSEGILTGPANRRSHWRVPYARLHGRPKEKKWPRRKFFV